MKPSITISLILLVMAVVGCDGFSKWNKPPSDTLPERISGTPTYDPEGIENFEAWDTANKIAVRYNIYKKTNGGIDIMGDTMAVIKMLMRRVESRQWEYTQLMSRTVKMHYGEITFDSVMRLHESIIAKRLKEF